MGNQIDAALIFARAHLVNVRTLVCSAAQGKFDGNPNP
jgi:hypothetical protein